MADTLPPDSSRSEPGFAAPGAEALNVIEIGGRMVERLHLEQAERLMHKVRQISARKDIA